ncbi:MAG TPA: hypothetical protein VG710_03995 [Opitutus sp.]|nr:hypothetical protein [Opitutus sp.]
MSTLPPLPRDQRKIDADHLKLLSVFHFVFAALALVGLGFLFLHWFMMHTFLENPDMWKNQKGAPPPREFFAVFKWFYLFFGTMIVGGGVLNALSGWFIRRRRARIFSLVVAGLDCLMMPLGPVLGVFTLIVLLRDSVAEAYTAAASPPPAGGSCAA